MEEIVNKLQQIVHDEITETQNLISKQVQEVKDIINGVPPSKNDQQHPLLLYRSGHTIGEGGHGTVYQVYDRETGEAYAMKEIDLKGNTLTLELVKEISTLYDIKHDNVIKLEKVHYYKGRLYLVMEHAGDDLNRLIQWGKCDPSNIKVWLRELLNVVDFLHKNGLIHRTIKPENILIDPNEKMKLADFGSVKRILDETELTPKMSFVQLRPPEVLLRSKVYGKASDMWGVGCTFAEMVIGKPLFQCESETNLLNEIFSKLGTPKGCLRLLPNFPRDAHQYPAATEITPKLDADGNDLMLKLLAVDPEDRISAEEALKHPYFAY